ncbi:TetR/AcrR family transcriptional regulator [Sanguibacter suaedae]|uniref:TetR/AcrR family transcriptional regulator n=1 Tax=Sanguibacter suaedae TaxID=2795737 RepID=A0A934M5U6_9MICO|nr:TetR/AcrR family transcriptional regulator [Sanguibacter suaedae]MBI9113502.1 TetR/AcrR family transcriptional regulator [Sanguibacter suaedae]
MSDSTRDSVVEAADHLFYERGVQAVGMDQLRTAAGVSLKRLYSEFPSKDAILLAVLDRRTHSWQHGIEGRVALAATPRDRVLAVYDHILDWACEDGFRGCGFLNTFGELGSTHPAVADATRAHKERFVSYVTGLCEDAGATAEVARQLVLLAEGAQTMAAVTDDASWARDARAAAETLLDTATR